MSKTTRRTAAEVRKCAQKKITISCKVDKEVWLKLDAIREAYNCKSIYIIANGLIDMFCKHMTAKQTRELETAYPGNRTIQDIHEEIEEMFSDLSAYESPRYGERTKRGHKSWDYFGEQETTSIDFLIEQEATDDQTDGEYEQG